MHLLNQSKKNELEKIAEKIRERIITMLLAAGSGHVAGSLGFADIFTLLYFHVLRHDPQNPLWENRDYVVLSAGHICPVQYATLATAGYFPLEELNTLRKINSRLQGHPHRGSLPGIETTSGPLGTGLSQAIGIGLAHRINHKKNRIFCVTSDGEHQEGNHWEAVMAAAKFRLNFLTVIVDRNNIQIDGHTENVMPLDPLKKKYEAFNWHVLEVDGHNMDALVSAISEAENFFERPTVIIAHTIPGKGVDFMENQYLWHGKAPNATEAKKALNELRTLRGVIQSEN